MSLPHPLSQRIMTALWVCIVLGAALIVARHQQESLRALRVELRVEYLALSLSLLAVAKVLLSRVLMDSARGHGLILSRRDAFRIHQISQLSKYVPGGIWHFASKAHLLARRGASPPQALRILVTETWWLVASSVVFGLTVLVLNILETPGLVFTRPDRLPLAGMTVVTLLAASVLFVRKKSMLVVPTKGVAARLCGVWILLGLSFFSATASLDPTLSLASLRSAALLIGAFALSFTVGMLTPFAPAGLGVREGALVAITAGVLGASVATAAAIVSRLLFVATDVLMAASTAAFSPSPKNSTS